MRRDVLGRGQPGVGVGKQTAGGDRAGPARERHHRQPPEPRRTSASIRRGARRQPTGRRSASPASSPSRSASASDRRPDSSAPSWDSRSTAGCRRPRSARSRPRESAAGVAFRCSGTAAATPRIRKSIAALSPAANPMPMACSARMPGNASSDGDSTIHVMERRRLRARLETGPRDRLLCWCGG